MKSHTVERWTIFGELFTDREHKVAVKVMDRSKQSKLRTPADEGVVYDKSPEAYDAR